MTAQGKVLALVSIGHGLPLEDGKVTRALGTTLTS